MEALQGEPDVAPADIGLAVFGQEPDALHVQQVRQGAGRRFAAGKEADSLERPLVLVVPQLVLGSLAVDVPVPRVERPGVVHRLGRLLRITVVFPYPRPRHVEVDVCRPERDGFLAVFLGLGEVAAEAVIVMLGEEVQGGGLAF